MRCGGSYVVVSMQNGPADTQRVNGTAARTIPVASVARLPVYLRALHDLTGEGVTNVSSERLAELVGVNAAKVRKDLSYLGSYGTRGVGYDVEYLMYQMNRELGLTNRSPIVIVGAGNLGSALANYGGFDERGYVVAGLFDLDPAKIGRESHGVVIRHIDELLEIVSANAGAIGVIATPPSAAQDAADRLVRAGVRSILNFAPVMLTHPAGVVVRKVDLAVELQILSFYQQRADVAAVLSLSARGNGNGRKAGSIEQGSAVSSSANATSVVVASGA
jgi:redox-sensing transcriptional repressor